MSRFRDLGFPVARRGNEEWKYTDIGPIARTPFHTAHTAGTQEPTTISSIELSEATLSRPDGIRLVFVDGVYSQALSFIPTLPAGATVSSLAHALETEGDLVKQHLTRYAEYQDNAFTALNTAFLHHGAFVHVQDGVSLEEPVHILFLFTGRESDTATHPRVLIATGRDSKATIVESYVSLSEVRYFANAVTEVMVGRGSSVKYYKVQQQSPGAYHITNTHVFNSQDASFTSMNLDLGGGLVRNNLNVLMAEEGCSCTLNGLYMLSGAQHVDNQVIIDHASSYTNASELYKGILNDSSRSVFHGSISVRKGVKKVNARQVDKNLLLSDQAEADTKPAFWIYADDVKCGHGAACGQMDENALFYLRSRGVEEKDARRMLTRAFASEVVDSIEVAALRERVDRLVQARLTRWFDRGELDEKATQSVSR